LSTSISSKSASANHCSESAWKAYMCSSAPTNRLRTYMYKPESLWVMCFNLCKLVMFYPVVTLMNFRQNLHVLSDICTEWKTKTEGNKKKREIFSLQTKCDWGPLCFSFSGSLPTFWGLPPSNWVKWGWHKPSPGFDTQVTSWFLMCNLPIDLYYSKVWL
jgi:hypothetical protein